MAQNTATEKETGAVARTDSTLHSPQGRTSIADGVVQKIAGIATREVSGVHNLGTGSARVFGALRERIPGSGGPAITQGVAVEVGEKQAAIDLDIVVEYGVAIAQLATNIRHNVISSVERMTGLEVIEVNIAVDDIHLPGDEEPANAPTRVE
ncbi:MAG: Asp23/Gls24 family envelope stress response protein [Mycobacteriales bacterium]|nr:MAG: Asp23/Gls24 family envelope stress response protein [Pseudonocardiales bacterium]